MDADKVLEQILKDYVQDYQASRKIQAINRKIDKGIFRYSEAEDLAQESGRILEKAFRNYLPEALTDGKLFRATAEVVLKNPMLQGSRDVRNCAVKIQRGLNEQADIGIDAIVPEVNEDQINGIITGICNAESFAAREETLYDQVENFLEGTVDDFVRENADFQYKAGLEPTIERRTDGKCCTWCSRLAGNYLYADVSDRGNDVFRRHKNCHCQILFNPGDGSKRRQNVHNRQWTDEGRNDRIAFAGSTGNDKTQLVSLEITNLRNEYVAKSLGAKSVNYDIMDLVTGEKYHLAEGEYLHNKQVFAGKGSETPYYNAQKYADRYGGKAEDWQHVKGFGKISTPDGDIQAEIHWSQCENIGKKEMFIKKWLE